MFSFLIAREFFVLNLIFNTICATSELRIVNGYLDSIENNPWQVSLISVIFLLNDQHECGGVIIEKKWVITADHSTLNRPTLFVRVRTADSIWWGTKIDIKRIIHYPVHESNDYILDFAIIELKSKLEFNAKVQPIKLPDENFDLTKNYSAAVSGYGQIGFEQEESEYLRRTNLSIIISDKCNLERRTTNRICARDPNEETTGTKINVFLLFISKLLF